jgi:thiol:disulfide interchange protein DsbD
VAPPLAAAVVYIGQQQDALLGGLALFALGLGMGAPLVAFGVGAGQWLPRAGAWMDAVKYAFGVVFLLLAVWMLERFLDPRWIMLMLAAIFIGAAVYMGALERLPERPSGWRTLAKAAGLLLFALGLAELIGALSGARDYAEPLQGLRGGGTGSAAGTEHAGPAFKLIKSSADFDRELAAASGAGRPLILDFYADWCVSCKEMEKYTFTAPDVRQALGGFVLLKADVTANDEDDQALMKRFGIIGPPGTLFFGRDGTARESLRLIGFEEAGAFAQRLGRAAQ